MFYVENTYYIGNVRATDYARDCMAYSVYYLYVVLKVHDGTRFTLSVGLKLPHVHRRAYL